MSSAVWRYWSYKVTLTPHGWETHRLDEMKE